MPAVFSPNRALEFSRFFLLYIGLIFVCSIAGMADYAKKKTHEKTTIENKKPDESMNKQNRENHMRTDDRAGFKLS